MLSNPLNCDWATNVRGNSTFWSTVPSCAPSCVCVCVSIETNPKVFQIVFILLLFDLSLHTALLRFQFEFHALIISLVFIFRVFHNFAQIFQNFSLDSHNARVTCLNLFFFISQREKERRAHEERTVCVACSKATESTQSLSKRPTRTLSCAVGQPVAVGSTTTAGDTHGCASESEQQLRLGTIAF